MKNNIFKNIYTITLYFILFFVLSVFAYSQETAKQKLIIVPLALGAEGQIVSDLVGQKMLASFQNNKSITTDFTLGITFSINNAGRDEDFKNVTQKYFKQGNDVVVIVWASKKSSTETNNTINSDINDEYNTRVLFFQKVEEKKLKETTITTNTDKVLGTDDFFNITPKFKKAEVTRFISKMSDLQFFVKEARITFVPVWKQKTKPPAYSVVVNGKKQNQTSLKKVVVTEQANHIEILQEDVVIGAFTVELNNDEYFVEIALHNEEELNKRQKKQAVKFSYLDSLFTIDFLAGGMLFLYTNQTDSQIENNGNGDLVGGITRMSVKLPKVPYFKMGLEIPFGFPLERKNKVRLSLIGLSGFVGVAFPLVKGLEMSLNVGGGAFLLNQIQTVDAAGKKKTTQPDELFSVPEFFAGINLDYNIPVKNAGYFRVTLNISPYIVMMPIDNVVEEETISLGTTTNLYLGIFAGLGWRF